MAFYVYQGPLNFLSMRFELFIFAYYTNPIQANLELPLSKPCGCHTAVWVRSDPITKCPARDLNPKHLLLGSNALPTELSGRCLLCPPQLLQHINDRLRSSST